MFEAVAMPTIENKEYIFSLILHIMSLEGKHEKPSMTTESSSDSAYSSESSVIARASIFP